MNSYYTNFHITEPLLNISNETVNAVNAHVIIKNGQNLNTVAANLEIDLKRRAMLQLQKELNEENSRLKNNVLEPESWLT